MNPAKTIEWSLSYISIIFSICFIIGKKIDCLKIILILLVPYNRIHVCVCAFFFYFACAQIFRLLQIYKEEVNVGLKKKKPFRPYILFFVFFIYYSIKKLSSTFMLCCCFCLAFLRCHHHNNNVQ